MDEKIQDKNSEKTSEIFQSLIECEDYLAIMMKLYIKEQKGSLFMMIRSAMNLMQKIYDQLLSDIDGSLDLVRILKNSISGFKKYEF